MRERETVVLLMNPNDMLIYLIDRKSQKLHTINRSMAANSIHKGLIVLFLFFRLQKRVTENKKMRETSMEQQEKIREHETTLEKFVPFTVIILIS